MGIIDNIASIKEIRIKGNSKHWFNGSISEAINVYKRKQLLMI